MKSLLKQYLILTIGTLLISLGVYFFKFNNHFSTGGVTGISIILGYLVPNITPATFVFIFNIIFLALGFIFLNKGFGAKTIYCSILLSVSLRALEILFPLTAPITNQKFMELIYSVAIPAVGSAMLFNESASSGGTEIAAMIMKKFSSFDIGKCILVSDLLIAGSAFFVFDVETGLFSMFGLVIKSMIIDFAIESFNLKKSFTIITTNPHDVSQYININLHRGATIWEAQGTFTEEKKWVIITALNRYQANMLKNYVKATDPNGFMLITNTSSIIGKGFKEI